MGLSLVERLVVKLAWNRWRSKVGKSKFRTWAPVIALVVLALATVARLAGNGDVANSIEAIGATVGLTDQSPIPATEVATTLGLVWAAYLGLAGAYRKFQSARHKADGPVSPGTLSKLGGLGVVLLALLVLPGCALKGSKALVQFGADAVKSPDPVTVFGWICANQPDRATAYLNFPDFGWVGQGGRDRYLVDALQKKAAGECPCPALGGCPGQGVKP